MPWFKIDDGLHSHPKVRPNSLQSVGLWAVSGSFCMQHMTDGFVPNWFVCQYPGGKKAAAELVETGRWQATKKDGTDGYIFHDWDEYQPTSTQVKADREDARERQRRSREARRSGDGKLKAVKDSA